VGAKAGREMRDHDPFAVVSTACFHSTVGLVVGCAMTSAATNRGSSLAVVDVVRLREGMNPSLKQRIL
jgi:mRNA-degrading endonuclease toxin of MazEF toxin-antitoxin module